MTNDFVLVAMGQRGIALLNKTTSVAMEYIKRIKKKCLNIVLFLSLSRNCMKEVMKWKESFNQLLSSKGEQRFGESFICYGRCNPENAIGEIMQGATYALSKITH